MYESRKRRLRCWNLHQTTTYKDDFKKKQPKNQHHTKDNQSKTFESIKTLQDKVLSPAGKMALVLSADIQAALLQIQYIL